MPVYAWKGLNAGGKNVAGTRDADGAKMLRQILRKLTDALSRTLVRRIVREVGEEVALRHLPEG